MRKILLLMVGFAISLTACQKNEGLVSDAITTSSFTITIPQSGISTRAVTDAFGTGTSVNRCILEIYHSDQLYSRIVKPISNKQVTFDNLRLVSSQEYDFVFWADCATANSGSDEGFDDKVYITTATGGLKAITEKGEFVGNSDERDAFFAKESFEVTGSFTESVTLKRPFGLLVVKTNDLNEIKDEALKPTGYKVAFKGLATTFNALTGEVSGSADVTYTAEELAKADGTISMDFLWATDTEAALSDFSMTFLNNSTEICTNDAFTNIPIRRNYRTNVSGNLLTKQGTINVTIDPEFEQPDLNDYPELRAALANGGSVALSEDVTISAPLVVESGKTVEIDLNGHDIINTTSLPDDTDPRYGNTTVFEVKGGATLNIKGDGDVKAIGTNPDEDGYRMAVYAYDDAKVNIYGGNFSNDQDYNNHQAQLDLIYADQNAVINIYGGTFESKSANDRGYWVLNLKDGSNAAINVYGGTFVNFDPSNSMTENPVKNFVVATSTTVKVSEDPQPNGSYEVVPEGGVVSVPIEVNDAESLTEALSNPVVANIEVASSINLSEESVEALTFEEHKTIDIKNGVTIQLGKTNYLTAEKGLTLTGKGTIDNTSEDNSDLGNGYQKSLIHVKGGECIIDGVTLVNDPKYHWHGSSSTGHPYNSAAIAYWNDADVTIKNARIISGEFAICGMGRDVANGEISLVDSYFESTSSNKDNGEHWAYAMRLYGSKIRIDNCEVKGIQGGISIEGCQDAVINGGKYYTENTPGQKDAFYALYITNGARVTIMDGVFSAANDWSGLQIGGTSAVVSGDNDADLPAGNVILRGGKFSGKAYNHVTKAIYEPVESYKWQAIEDDPAGLKWEVVAE